MSAPASSSYLGESREGEITRLLRAWSDGEDGAAEELLALTYERLRRRAAGLLAREHRRLTLETSELIHETYLRLLEQRRFCWRNRAQFMAIAARMMRRILVNYVRDRSAEKRGGRAQKLRLEEASQIGSRRPASILDLDDSLSSLGRSRPDLAQIVELRFFGGFSNEEISELLGISTPTIVRRWRLARACLNLLMTENAVPSRR